MRDLVKTAIGAVPEYEPWPVPGGPGWRRFRELWDLHGCEVRGEPLALDHHRYQDIERDGRLIWVVAREQGLPIAYSGHFWYKSLHFDERLGHDDLWFVAPAYRGLGIGRKVKEMGHAALKKAGCVATEDLIRANYDHPHLMADLGFKAWGTRWRKEFR